MITAQILTAFRVTRNTDWPRMCRLTIKADCCVVRTCLKANGRTTSRQTRMNRKWERIIAPSAGMGNQIMPRRKVEIWTAYQWTCDECGQDNFERAVMCELTPFDREMMAEENDLEPEDFEGEMVSYPNHVTCQHCKAEFDTVGIHDDDEDWNQEEI